MKRPLKNNRPLGPILDFSSDNSENNFDEIDTQEVRQFKQDIESQTNQDITMVEAKAVMVIDAEMLQSYIVNTFDTASQYSNKDVTVQSVMKSKPTQKYARKMGAEDELQKAIQVYN